MNLGVHKSPADCPVPSKFHNCEWPLNLTASQRELLGQSLGSSF